MRIVALLLLFNVLISSFSYAQKYSVDSLKNELQKTKEDTIIIKDLNNICIALQGRMDYDKAMQYASDAKKRCEKFLIEKPQSNKASIITRELARATVNIGIIETYRGNYTEGLRNDL